MMKYFCKLLLLISILLTGISASASQYVDGITFLNLNFDSKVKMIKEAQIMATKMEHLQNTAAKKKKYYSYLKFLSNLLVSSANANHINNEELCIYAGWLSMMVDNKCTHPLNIRESKTLSSEQNDLLSKISGKLFSGGKLITEKEYKKNSGCTGQKQIICSPDLFGKHPKTNQPFCVKHGNQDPYNSSFACLRKVQELSEDDQKAVYKEIVERVAGSDKAGESNLITMFRLYYDICMCNGDSKYINKSYAERMFKSRTCNSWLQQTNNIMNQFNPTQSTCNDLLEPESDNNQAYTIGRWLNKAHDNIRSRVLKDAESADLAIKTLDGKLSSDELRAQDEKWANQRLEDYKKNKSNSCPIKIDHLQPPPTPPIVDELKSKIACTIEQSELKKDTPEEISFKLSIKILNDKNGKPFEVELGDNNAKVEVKWGDNLTSDPKKDRFTATLVQTPDAKVKSVTASVKLGNDQPHECPLKVTYPDDPVVPPNSGEYKITATLEPEEGEDAVLVAKVTKGKDDVTEEFGDQITWIIKENEESNDKDDSKEKDDNSGEPVVIEDDGDILEGFKKLDSGAKVTTKKTKKTQLARAELILKGKKPIRDEVTIPALAAKKVKEEKKLQNTGPKYIDGPPPPKRVGTGETQLFHGVR